MYNTVLADGEPHDEGEAWPSSTGSPGCNVALESGFGFLTRKTAEPTTRQRGGVEVRQYSGGRRPDNLNANGNANLA